MNLPVAILAGGFATRLGGIAEHVPKALLDIASEPFAVKQIKLLREHELSQIVFCVGHLGRQVEEQLGDGRAWGVSLKFAYDGPVPLGTGGALLNALPLLGSRFLVMYGDAYLDCDYQEVIRAFAAAGTLGLMTVYRNRGRWDTSNVHFQNGTIEAYDKRRPTSSMEHIDYGLGMLQASALEPYRVGEPLDLATVYQDLLAKNQLAGFEVTQRFYEIGSESGLAETRNYFLSRDRKSRP